MSYQFVDFADISNTVLQACFRQEEFMEAVEQELVSLKLTRYTHQMLFGTNPLSSSTNSCAWYNSLKTWQYSSAAMTPWPESSGLPFFSGVGEWYKDKVTALEANLPTVVAVGGAGWAVWWGHLGGGKNPLSFDGTRLAYGSWMTRKVGPLPCERGLVWPSNEYLSCEYLKI